MDYLLNNSADNADSTKFVKIRLDKEWYGIPIAIVENIVRMQRITRVPGSEVWIKGVINLRGKVVPVYSLRLKMGMEEGEEQRSTRIIILRVEGDDVGMIVDEVREVVSVRNEDVEQMYPDSTNPYSSYLYGVGKIGEDLITLLDMFEVLGVKVSTN